PRTLRRRPRLPSRAPAPPSPSSEPTPADALRGRGRRLARRRDRPSGLSRLLFVGAPQDSCDTQAVAQLHRPSVVAQLTSRPMGGHLLGNIPTRSAGGSPTATSLGWTSPGE